MALNHMAKNFHFFMFANASGLSAGLARQATYTTTRLGIYTWMLERFSAGGELSFVTKAVLGMGAGGVASVVGYCAINRYSQNCV